MVKAVRLIFFSFLLYPLSLTGQVYKFSDPESLPYNINSDAEEAMPILSANGKYLFFARSLWYYNKGGKYSGSDIWVSERTPSGWTRAINDHFRFNTKGNEVVIGMSEAGDVVYFMRTYANKKVKGIYFSKRVKGIWTEPELIPIAGLESLGSFGFYMHPEGNVLLISMKADDSRGEEDIYLSLKASDGTWSIPRNLGATINTSGTEISPFLSEDKRKLYFSSSGHKGLGDADIFVSFRLYDTWETWTAPVNLGEKVNSKKFDAYFSIYGDTLAYFTSNKEGKFSDIYTTSVTILDFDPDRKPVPLAEGEIAELIGDKVKRMIEFDTKNASLSATQRELLWFIAHRLITKKDVRIMLVSSPDDNLEITTNRLNIITTQLVSAGIEGSRIKRTQNAVTDNFPMKGEVHLVLVR